MKRDQFDHVVRAAAEVTGEKEFVVIGSQSILGEATSAPLIAPRLCMSVELDLYPMRKPELADQIEGALGNLSLFHEAHGYYADGVGPETAKLPDGWQDRLKKVAIPGGDGVYAHCLEMHDLAVSKLAAHRPKDLDFVAELLKHRLITLDVVRRRLLATSIDDGLKDAIHKWLDAVRL